MLLLWIEQFCWIPVAGRFSNGMLKVWLNSMSEKWNEWRNGVEENSLRDKVITYTSEICFIFTLYSFDLSILFWFDSFHSLLIRSFPFSFDSFGEQPSFLIPLAVRKRTWNEDTFVRLFPLPWFATIAMDRIEALFFDLYLNNNPSYNDIEFFVFFFISYSISVCHILCYSDVIRLLSSMLRLELSKHWMTVKYKLRLHHAASSSCFKIRLYIQSISKESK